MYNANLLPERPQVKRSMESDGLLALPFLDAELLLSRRRTARHPSLFVGISRTG